MRALQCFLMEFWDMSTRGLEAYLPQAALDGLKGGWCVELPQHTRICHLRWCASCPVPGPSGLTDSACRASQAYGDMAAS